MTPEKTGADVWLTQYQCWVHCDAFYIHRGFPMGDLYIFRATHVVFGASPFNRKHYEAATVLEWWKDSPVQTIIAENVRSFNLPDGVPA